MTVLCGECQQPVGERAVVLDGWARCRPCIDAWVDAQSKLTGEKAHDLARAIDITCKNCEKTIEPTGPLVIFILPTGEVGSAFCGQCVVARRLAYADQMMREELYTKVSYGNGRGRSRGMLTKEMMREGKQYMVIKSTIDAMITDGVFHYERGFLTIPSLQPEPDPQLQII